MPAPEVLSAARMSVWDSLKQCVLQHVPANLTLDAVRFVRSTKTVACSNSRV